MYVTVYYYAVKQRESVNFYFVFLALLKCSIACKFQSYNFLMPLCFYAVIEWILQLIATFVEVSVLHFICYHS